MSGLSSKENGCLHELVHGLRIKPFKQQVQSHLCLASLGRIVEEVVIEGVLIADVHLRGEELYNGNQSVASSQQHDLATGLPEDMHADLPQGCLSL